MAERWFSKTALKVRKISFEWTIENYDFLHQKTGEYLESSSFYAADDPYRKWRLRLYPKGRNNSKYVALFLLFKTGNILKKEVTAKFKITVVSEKNTEFRYGVQILKEETEYGNEYFLSVSEYYSEENGGKWSVLPDDTMKLLCDVQVMIYTGTPCETKTLAKDVPTFPLEFSSCLSDDLEYLLSGQGSDVTILIGKDSEEVKCFSAHKAVLTARSPVFAAMFKNDCKESQQNRVDITDMKPDVFGHLLQFIYSARLSSGMVTKDLLLAADKYDIPSLKKGCEEALSEALTVDNAIEMLYFATENYALHLKAAVLNFIGSNAEEIS